MQREAPLAWSLRASSNRCRRAASPASRCPARPGFRRGRRPRACGASAAPSGNSADCGRCNCAVLVFAASATSSSPSSTLVASGFSHSTCLPACKRGLGHGKVHEHSACRCGPRRCAGSRRMSSIVGRDIRDAKPRTKALCSIRVASRNGDGLHGLHTPHPFEMDAPHESGANDGCLNSFHFYPCWS